LIPNNAALDDVRSPDIKIQNKMGEAENPVPRVGTRIQFNINMKTKHFFLSMIALAIFSVGIVGCQKEQLGVAEAQQHESELLGKISTQTSDYLSTVTPSVAKGGKGKRILAADLKGFVSTFITTATIIGGIPPYGLEISAGIAVIGGAAASIEAGIEGGNPGGGGGGIANPGNPMDGYGEMHYILVAEIQANHGPYFENNGHIRYETFFDYGFNRMAQAGYLNASDRPSAPVTTLEALHPSFLTEEGLVPFVMGMNNPEFLPTERAILAQYFGALMASNNATDFGNYSVGIENQIAGSSMSGKSKALLLIEMATARRGYAYWDN
jgi:hypothetical protein